ncbi:hypothetical protein [Morganella morganii]|uniref:hypothetical protein n=1 Tax=Morganella morganii TaxID=582 RepID=UPI000C7B4C32|nr:hypothetical protein [Morganella morganii]PLA34338.1 hypothetical protein CYJ97_07225 [Morganella morganii]QPJ67493.1 hypothetical protein IR188_12565 [Morganella morganii]
MSPTDLDKRIEKYRKKLSDAAKLDHIHYKIILKQILYEIVLDLKFRIYTEEEAQKVWRSVLPGFGLEGYDEISESFDKSEIYKISFDAADELAEILSAYRRDNK